MAQSSSVFLLRRRDVKALPLHTCKTCPVIRMHCGERKSKSHGCGDSFPVCGHGPLQPLPAKGRIDGCGFHMYRLFWTAGDSRYIPAQVILRRSGETQNEETGEAAGIAARNHRPPLLFDVAADEVTVIRHEPLRVLHLLFGSAHQRLDLVDILLTCQLQLHPLLPPSVLLLSFAFFCFLLLPFAFFCFLLLPVASFCVLLLSLSLSVLCLFLFFFFLFFFFLCLFLLYLGVLLPIQLLLQETELAAA